MKLLFKYTILGLLCFVYSCSSSQDQTSKQYADVDFKRIAFYNVENLFDIYNDSLTNDDEFTPEGERNWNNKRFYHKLNNIYRVIIGMGEWNPPVIVGLSEVENRFVLNKLVYQTPLKTFDYKIIHEESPDRRGIDVALIYRSSQFVPIEHHTVGIRFPFDTASRTRDILYVKGVLSEKDTVHVFVNHWPSRYGGYLVTKPKREFVASVLRKEIDSLYLVDYDPNIIIMGDFNDEPWDESVMNELNAKMDTLKLQSNDLFNLMSRYQKDWDGGTNKYQEDWGIIDQFIVSANLISGKQNLQILNKSAIVYSPEFLLEEDFKYLGKKPFRTYVGFSYNRGYSDHLPIYIDLISSEE
jgi:endonuclease/exonuclease/phosphatase family metal-dependent hydrolase